MVSVPRSITGSAGSRVRLIFGDSGNEWLLILNHDNGNRQWQTKHWKSIPDKVAKQLNNCTNKGRAAKFVDFGPNGTWFINGVKAGGLGDHSWWGGTMASKQIEEWTSSPNNLQVSFGGTTNGSETYVLIQGDNGYCCSGGIHIDLKERLTRIHNSRKNFDFVRLFHHESFFVSDDEGSLWRMGNNPHCDRELQKSGKVKEVAMAGDNSWVVVRGNNYASSKGVDDELDQKLNEFFSDQRRWINSRKREIGDARAAQERERLTRAQEARDAREAVERATREAAERTERETIQRGAREAERSERESREQEAKETTELNAATRISSLETILGERLVEEAKSIKETEASLQSRKRSLRGALESMPPEIQGRVDLGDENQGTDTSANGNDNICVVCQDESAVMAVVPCGHVCLCYACSDACINRQNGSRLCPLCRGNMQSVLRIFVGR